MEKLRDVVATLYDVRDHVFGSKKKAQIGEHIAQAQQVYKALPSECRESAEAIFLLGKALDANDAYDAQAEQLLSRSIKLDNTNPAAWCALGHCFWKNGQTLQAADCFRNGIDRGGEASVECLHNLGQLLRSMGATPQETVQNSRTSVEICKRALKLGFTNPQSWYLLGNALLSSYYVDKQQGGRDNLPAKILAAYANAETHGQAGKNPDLYFNRAKFHK